MLFYLVSCSIFWEGGLYLNFLVGWFICTQNGLEYTFPLVIAGEKLVETAAKRQLEKIFEKSLDKNALNWKFTKN